MTASHQLRTSHLVAGYSAEPVIDGLRLDIPDGVVTAIIGLNACGKSTLLKSLCRILKPRSGQVLLDGTPLSEIGAKPLARMIGMLPQSPVAPEGITVAELVGQGRHPHHGLMSRWNADDERAVADALYDTGTVDLAERAVDELSGGQRQRVWIAMALAQQPDILLLDEPTTYLDVSHQVEVLDLLTDLNDARGTTVVMVLHDLNLAARYADHLVLMADGGCYAQGVPSEVFTEQAVADVFGLTNRVIVDPISNTPMMLPIGRHHSAGTHQNPEPGETR